MTRIIGGDLRGRKLKVPEVQTRPTSSRVREAIFSSVEHAVSGLSDLRVLDLFAGSGALGIESISRGAAEAVLIERDLRAADTLHSNIESLGLKTARVVITDAIEETSKSSSHGKFDVVFIDPPYELVDEQVDVLLGKLVKNGWLADFALLVVERGAKSKVIWPKTVEELRQKFYGDTTIWYGQYLEEAVANEEGE
jgi:16S rRNA (guanine966-N2)-methyltransferase